MNLTPPASPSFRARPSFTLAGIAFLGGGVVLALRAAAGPWASLAGAMAVLPFDFWVVVRTSLHRRLFRGKTLAMLGFLVASLGLSDAVGQICYHRLWREAFRLTGREAVFENRSEGWKVRYPGDWSAQSMKSEGVNTFFFKPERSTPAVEFSLTHRPGAETPDLDDAVRRFLEALPKGGDTQILFRGRIAYPQFQNAAQVIYEDPTQPVVLRHRVVFLSHEEGLTVLSVAAVPAWLDRLAPDAERFLFSFEPLN